MNLVGKLLIIDCPKGCKAHKGPSVIVEQRIDHPGGGIIPEYSVKCFVLREKRYERHTNDRRHGWFGPGTKIDKASVTIKSSYCFV